jgi:hypothetical protein
MGQNQQPFHKRESGTHRGGMRHSTTCFMLYACVFIHTLKCLTPLKCKIRQSHLTSVNVFENRGAKAEPIAMDISVLNALLKTYSFMLRIVYGPSIFC